MTDQKFTALNRQGLIPGPGESEGDFLKRAQFCLDIKRVLKEQLREEWPFSFDDIGNEVLIQDGLEKIERLYDCAPTWAPVVFNNHKLTFWHGGCAWIFQLADTTPTSALLQLRAQFQKSPKYLGLYKRDELIAHEMAHIGRMMFQEPQFEEVLAYRTSTSWFRRWFGPIVQSPKESLWFILILGVMILADLSVLALDHKTAYSLSLWTKLLPLGLVLLAMARLGWRQWQFTQCLKQLTTVYKDATIAERVIYRLRDNEIKAFARMSTADIKAFIYAQSYEDMRWRVIKSAYPIAL